MSRRSGERPAAPRAALRGSALGGSALPSAALVAAVLLSGCSPSTVDDGGDSASATPDLEAHVYKSRQDLAFDTAQVQLVNRGDRPVTVERVQVDSPAFDAPMTWTEGPTEIGPGRTVDLPVQLPAPACPATPDAELRVTVQLVGEAATDDEVRVTADDPYEQLPAVVAEGCLARQLDAVATLATRLEAPRGMASASPSDGDGPPPPGERPPATLVVTLTPTGGDGEVEVREARSTVLFSMLDRRGRPIAASPIDRVLRADGTPTKVRLPIAPARCDDHALADDKVGTMFRIELAVDGGTPGLLRLPVDAGLKRELFDYLTAACRIGEASR